MHVFNRWVGHLDFPKLSWKLSSNKSSCRIALTFFKKLRYKPVNLLTVKLYNLSPVLDIQIDFIFGLQFVSDIQTVQSVSDIQTGLNTVNLQFVPDVQTVLKYQKLLLKLNLNWNFWIIYFCCLKKFEFFHKPELKFLNYYFEYTFCC